MAQTERPVLIVMRLADMERHHAQQVTERCDRCGHVVGIYPSGQQVIQQHPDVEIVCQVCMEPGSNALLAPGAMEEAAQSRKRKPS